MSTPRLLTLFILVGCSSPAAPPPTIPKGPTTTVPPVAKATPEPATPAQPPELTCKTIEAAPTDGYCGQLEKQPRAEAGALVTKAAAVWRRVEPPFHALSGRESAMVVLSPDARIDNTPIQPAAYICPGAPPTVYVPATLVELIDSKDAKKYPEDFLAFVIGHELGHRMNDLTRDGCRLAAFQRPGQGAWEEELADARSAFFITTAGFSASRVGREDLVGRFLEGEYKLDRSIGETRHTSLLDALSKFDSYEAMYQTGLTVAMAGELDAADRLLTWADELVESHGVLLPELRIVRAIARIERASKIAPWQSELDIPVGIESLHCTAVHPGHSGLYEEPAQRVRGDITAGRKLLQEALALLDQAEARGGTPFTIASARTCAHLYLADATAATEQQARAEALLPANAPAAVKQVLAENRALVTFLGFARTRKPPTIDKPKELEAWATELEKALGGANAPAGLATVIAALHDPGAKPPKTARNILSCADPKATPPAQFAAIPAHGAAGTCPTGYTVTTVMPPPDPKAKPSGQGLTVCKANAGTAELSIVHLDEVTTKPKQKALDRSLLVAPAPAALAQLDAWACHCKDFRRQGVSDRGDVVYDISCPALKLDSGVAVFANGRVETVIQLGR